MTVCALTIGDKALEVAQHRAWWADITEAMSVQLLELAPVMSYLLRQDPRAEYEYWISHKDMDGVIRHRHFVIREYETGCYFENYAAPTATSLDDFIEGALVCKIFPE